MVHGLNATADSFYASQGRLGGDFEDHNAQLVRRGAWQAGMTWWPGADGCSLLLWQLLLWAVQPVSHDAPPAMTP